MSNNNQREVYQSLGYATVIPYTENQVIDINYINSIAQKKAPRRIILRLDNTKQLTTSNMRLFADNIDFHIMGAYDSDRVEKYGKIRYDNGETGSYYTSAVIYERGELRQILGKIEMIEKGIKPGWSPLQKLIYIYEQIQKEIIYDPKYEQKLSRDVRSLRGLISNQSVCAGFALILKEILDRNGVPCEYVSGKTNRGSGHAWNIVTIDGKKYAVDLTWDTRQFLTTGAGISFRWMTTSPEEFSRSHLPYNVEKTQNYRVSLSTMSPDVVKGVRDRIRVESKYKTNIYHGTRSNGSRFIVSSLGTIKVNGGIYYTYFYQPVNPDGSRGPISLLYGKYNITKLLDDIVWNRNYNRQEKYIVDNVLFSEANIRLSSYVGTIYNASGRFATSPGEIVKSSSDMQFFDSVGKRRFIRSDGSQFLVRESGQVRYFDSMGHRVPIHTYIIVERLYERGEEAIKMNVVYTEMDLIKDNRSSLIANFLTRQYIERRLRDGGGYIGYLNETGNIITHPFVGQNFDTAGRVDASSFGHK